MAKRQLDSRCSVSKIQTLAASLSAERVAIIRELGFGGLLDLEVRDLRNDLCHWLVKNYDIKHHYIQMVEKQARLPAGVDEVRGLLGIPSSGRDLVVQQEKVKDEYFNGLGYSLKKLEEQLREVGSDEHFRRLFLIFVCATFLSPTARPEGERCIWDTIWRLDLGESINWAQFLISRIEEGCRKYMKATSSDVHYFRGCLYFLQYVYLSSTYIYNSRPPAGEVLTEGQTTERLRAELRMHRTFGRAHLVTGATEEDTVESPVRRENENRGEHNNAEKTPSQMLLEAAIESINEADNVIRSMEGFRNSMMKLVSACKAMEPDDGRTARRSKQPSAAVPTRRVPSPTPPHQSNSSRDEIPRNPSSPALLGPTHCNPSSPEHPPQLNPSSEEGGDPSSPSLLAPPHCNPSSPEHPPHCNPSEMRSGQLDTLIPAQHSPPSAVQDDVNKSIMLICSDVVAMEDRADDIPPALAVGLPCAIPAQRGSIADIGPSSERVGVSSRICSAFPPSFGPPCPARRKRTGGRVGAVRTVKPSRAVSSPYVVECGKRGRLTSMEMRVGEFVFGEGRPPRYVMAEFFEATLTRDELCVFKPDCWVCDKSVSALCKILNRQRPLCRFFDPVMSATLEGLTEEDYGDPAVLFNLLEHEFKSENGGSKIGDCNLLFFPICRHEHWHVHVLNMQEQRVELLSSLRWPAAPEPSVEFTKRLAAALHSFGYFVHVPIATFPHQVMKVPPQKNRNDCGMFCMRFMEHWQTNGLDGKVDGVNMNLQRLRTAVYFVTHPYNSVRDRVLEDMRKDETVMAIK